MPKMEDFKEKLDAFYDGETDRIPTIEEYQAAYKEYVEQLKPPRVGSAMIPLSVIGGIGGTIAGISDNKANLIFKGLLGAAAGAGVGAFAEAASRGGIKMQKKYLEDPTSEKNKRKIKRLYREELSDRPYTEGYTDAKFWG